MNTTEILNQYQYQQYKHWKPTVANINALPNGIRHYICDLETLADPAGIVKQNVFLKDACIALQKMLRELKEEMKHNG